MNRSFFTKGLSHSAVFEWMSECCCIQGGMRGPDSPDSPDSPDTGTLGGDEAARQSLGYLGD